MLTLLDSITPIESTISNLVEDLDNQKINFILKNLDKDPILFHLDSNLSNYIKVLTRELKHFIAEQLSIQTHSYIDSDSSTKSMIIAALQESDY